MAKVWLMTLDAELTGSHGERNGICIHVSAVYNDTYIGNFHSDAYFLYLGDSVFGGR